MDKIPESQVYTQEIGPDEEIPIQENQDKLAEVPILETDNLNETVLEAAGQFGNIGLGPEVLPPASHLTAWDEPPAAAGYEIPAHLPEGETVGEMLVEAGNEEADRELRVASDDEVEE